MRNVWLNNFISELGWRNDKNSSGIKAKAGELTFRSNIAETIVFSDNKNSESHLTSSKRPSQNPRFVQMWSRLRKACEEPNPQLELVYQAGW